MTVAMKRALKVADEVWVAAALLHKENPSRVDFTVGEIMERAREETAAGDLRAGVYVHIVQHCVANRPPNPGRYRMLVETGKNKRRLFRPGDPFHSDREGGKSQPSKDDIPSRYHGLIDWYNSEYASRPQRAEEDPLLALRGSGKKIWANEHADEYVRRLREGWE